MSLRLKFRTSFRQFYLNDKNSNGDTSSDDFWSDDAFTDKLAVGEGVLGIGIENEEGDVECEFEILVTKSLIEDFSDFDHVVEASLKIHSGFVQVLDCPNSEIVMETAIENGDYRVRVYSKNLNTAYEKNPNDTYKIEMWKEVYSERKVLKRFE
ncbi:hypothetical protein [Gilvibacter sediminis]|uniref:hypothetical protein n=1 Tax=Gilvibacter sediminis TaxID=379071 RepID=UPI00234FEFB0|nr:hypothetical protein [Gilvibacter sediminis]MDC7997695.1 hypothetical protein [Gilvibacter sediminis]